MPTVIFVTLDGKEHEIEAEEGATLMEIGRDAYRKWGEASFKGFRNYSSA